MHVHSPDDVKRLRFDQLPLLAAQIRTQLIDTVARTGGHLASNLGVVELTIALHRVFSSPVDRIVFDVGHQCYTHKLLTGREGRFDTLRQFEGLSGFPKRAESEHDAFLAGHSSTSISAAIGLAHAKKLRGEPGKVVAVIGDGALSGLAFEALNNVDDSLDNLVVILNDNEMSISRNLTMIARHLAKIRNTRQYHRFKDGFENMVQHIPLLGKTLYDGMSGLKSAAKDYLYHSNLFEDMGFIYLGPVDGHDFSQLCPILLRARELNKPVLVHVHTQKGRGYLPAEENPGAFHGVSGFDPQKKTPDKLSANTFSEQAGMELTRLGEQDKSIVAITAAMKYATGLHHFSRRFRSEKRFFDVGIAESHAVVFASAMAAGGMKPVFVVYSSFLQRSYDQLLHDCSLEPTHVVIGVDRAGLVGEDGETHQGIFDVAFLSTLPGAVIYSPATFAMMRRDFSRAIYEEQALCAVRYPRGGERFSLPENAEDHHDWWTFGAADAENLLITYGRIAAEASRAAARCGRPCRIILLERIFPLPQEVMETAMSARRIVFVEEGAREGGLGEHMAALLLERGFAGEFVLRAIENPVVPQGTLEECIRFVGLDEESLCEVLKHDGFES